MFVRLATVADLDAMTWVLVGASPLDPIYPYRFPDRHLYPHEFTALCRQKCREYLATSTVVVCEMDVAETDPDAALDAGRRATKVVAFSAWDTPIRWLQPVGEPLPQKSPLPSPLSPITIGHLTRQQAFRSQCASYKHAFFDSHYSSSSHRGHMFLKILLCHPLYQRRGAGTALTRWGIDLAAENGLDTTVFASPMGLELYRKLGFREVGRFRVQVEGEGEFLEIPALVLGARDGMGWRREVGSERLLGVGGCEVGSEMVIGGERGRERGRRVVATVG